MAGIQWAFLALAIPFYFFSARILTFTSSYGPQKRLKGGATGLMK